jgi:hypothetical protein
LVGRLGRAGDVGRLGRAGDAARPATERRGPGALVRPIPPVVPVSNAATMPLILVLM